MNTLTIFLGFVILLTIIFIVYLFSDLFKNDEAKARLKEKKDWINLAVAGVITQFFDFMGIGSYGTLTAWFKFTKAVPDKLIPGTLNTCTIFTMTVMTVATVTVMEIEPLTLWVSAICAGIGGLVGSNVISKMNVNAIRWGMGIALIIVAAIIVLRQLGFMPGGGEAIGVHGVKLVILAVVAFILGALMTIGIGLYAPMMATAFLLGISPDVAYPLFMGTCAVMIPFAGINFVRQCKKTGKQQYDYKAIICISLFGCVGVAVGLFLITSLPLDAIKWIVSCVLVITAVTMFKSAVDSKKAVEPTEAEKTS